MFNIDKRFQDFRFFRPLAVVSYDELGYSNDGDALLECKLYSIEITSDAAAHPVRCSRRTATLTEGRKGTMRIEDIKGSTGLPLIRFTPETVVMRDQSYKPPSEETAR
jgi:hypothetical protein